MADESTRFFCHVNFRIKFVIFCYNMLSYSEALCTYDAYMVSNYSRYDIMTGTEECRAKHCDEQFPKDLKAAYELGSG